MKTDRGIAVLGPGTPRAASATAGASAGESGNRRRAGAVRATAAAHGATSDRGGEAPWSADSCGRKESRADASDSARCW